MATISLEVGVVQTEWEAAETMTFIYVDDIGDTGYEVYNASTDAANSKLTNIR